MNLAKEKRRDRRFEHETPIIVKEHRTENCYGGRMYNFSKKGMYIETDFECRPGEEISIVVEDPPYGSGPYLHQAQVKWSKELPEAVVFYRFACGTKYDLTVDYSLNRSDLPFKKRTGKDRRSGHDRRAGERDRRQDLYTDPQPGSEN